MVANAPDCVRRGARIGTVSEAQARRAIAEIRQRRLSQGSLRAGIAVFRGQVRLAAQQRKLAQTGTAVIQYTPSGAGRLRRRGMCAAFQ